MEVIESKGRRIALIFSADLPSEGTAFLSKAEDGLQLGVITRKQGDCILAHKHLSIKLDYQGPKQEFLYVVRGAMEVTFYDDDSHVIAKRHLKAGEAMLQLSGGHGFEFEADTRLIEVKQGPYTTRALDKVEIK